MRDVSFLQGYKIFLKESRNELIEDQFVRFAEENGIRPTVKLRKAFTKLVNLLDNEFDMELIMATNFLFDSLRSLKTPKEREMKKLIQNFSDFILTAGSGNTATHRRIRQMYSEQILKTLDGFVVDETVKKSDNFKTEWVATFKEHLNKK